MASDVRIIYEENGFPRELTDPREWARAVKAGSLATTTLVSVHRGNERAIVIPAGELPELRSIFGLDAPKPPDHRPLPSAPEPPPSPTAPASEPPAPIRPISQTTPLPAPGTAPPRASDAEDVGSNTAYQQPYRSTPDKPGNGMGKAVLAVIAGVLLLIVVLTMLSGRDTEQNQQIGNATAADTPLTNEASPVEVGQAIAEGTSYEWTDTGEPQTYVTGGLQLVFTSQENGEGAKVPVLTVRSADLGDTKVVGVAGGETASADFIVLRPSRTDRHPSVLFMTYSMGAHCCTSFKLLTPKGSAWTLADLGDWDGEPFATAPQDIDADGVLDFVMRDNGFLYAFASYADSWTPSLIYNVVDGRFADLSTSPRFRSVHLGDLARAKVECTKRNNGACAAFVASAARVGQQRSALQFAATSFDGAATDGWLPSRCQVPVGNGSCPAGSELLPSGFVEALEWFLEDRGYVRGRITTLPPPDVTPEPDTPYPTPSENDASDPDYEALRNAG